MATFRFNPHIPDMMAGLPAASKALGKDEAAWIEMMNRRDVELEDWLNNLDFEGVFLPPGTVAGDLYDDFTIGQEAPPPDAETGNVWVAGAGSFTTEGGAGLFNTNEESESRLVTDSLRFDARLRTRFYPSTSFTDACIIFRGLTGSRSQMELKFQTRDGGGSGLNGVEIRKRTSGSTTYAYTSSWDIVPGRPIDVDLWYVGTRIVLELDGERVFDFTATTGLELQTGVGFGRISTGYGAFENGDTDPPNSSHITYIWTVPAYAIPDAPFDQVMLHMTSLADPSAAKTATSLAAITASLTAAEALSLMGSSAPLPAVVPAGSGGPPTYIAPGETYTVAQYFQVLYAELIDVDGILAVDGVLVEVD